MIDLVILIIIICILLYLMYKHYEPRIEVIYSTDHHRVYLLYTKYKGTEYEERVCKLLITI